MLENLSKVHNRRKALIYVSNGYDFNPFQKSPQGEVEFFENRFGAAQLRQTQGDDTYGGTAQNQGDRYDGNTPRGTTDGPTPTSSGSWRS